MSIKSFTKKAIWIFKILIIVLGFSYIYIRIREHEFVKRSVVINDCRNDGFIQLHFIHGSKRLKEYPKEKVRMGGLWGGHVEIQIDTLVFGFQEERKPIHILPRFNKKNYNSIFETKKDADWLEETFADKITTIRIPVKNEQKIKLLRTFQEHAANKPHDYAVLGMRCTSYSLRALGNCHVVEQLNTLDCLLIGAYPAQFRKNIIKIATKKNWIVTTKKGTLKKTWK